MGVLVTLAGQMQLFVNGLSDRCRSWLRSALRQVPLGWPGQRGHQPLGDVAVEKPAKWSFDLFGGYSSHLGASNGDEIGAANQGNVRDEHKKVKIKQKSVYSGYIAYRPSVGLCW